MRKRTISSIYNGYKIIAIDDEIGIIDSLSVMLKRSGYEFTGFVDPLEAIESIREESYDLLILDYLMSPIHGDKVVEKIREFNDDLYILLLTGHKDLAPPLETIKALDIQGYCEKSDRFEQLLLLVESGIKSISNMNTIKNFSSGLNSILTLAPKIYQLQPAEDILKVVLPEILSLANSEDGFILIDELTQISEENKRGIFKGIGKYKIEEFLSEENPNYSVMEDLSLAKNSKQAICTKNSIVLPLINEYNEVIGSIYVDKDGEKVTDETFKMLKILSRQISSALNNSILHGVVNEKNNELNEAYEKLRVSYMDTIEVLRKAVDAKDGYTRGHSDRVSYYAVKIGEAFGFTEEQLEILRISGIFHDVGKIGTSDDILLKTGKLSEAEYDEIKKHPFRGANILSAISMFSEVVPIVKGHHERIDGKGYPKGLKGEDIPLCTKIISVADAFDAMTSDRLYRRRRSLDEAIEQLLASAGTQFDSLVVGKFISLLSNYENMVKEMEATYS